jgi:acetolactate synthase-1/2/3 large subunit
MKIYEALAKALRAEQPGPVFGVMGDGNLHLLTALAAEEGPDAVFSRHEAGAVAMADGYARSSGTVGVATVTCGPGLTQIGTSLMAANRARTPLVVLVGDTPARDPSGLQDFDQRAFAEAAGARFHAVHGQDTLVEDVRDAFHTARTLRCPVVLNAPIDVQQRDYDWPWEYRPSIASAVDAQRIHPDPALLTRVVEALAGSERPIVVVGRGAVASGAVDAVLAMAERIGALLATSLPARGAFAGHEFDLGVAGAFSCAPAEEAFAQADLVIGVGAGLGYYTTEGGFLFPDADLIRIDDAPAPQGGEAVPARHVRGDARVTAEALDALLAERGVQRTGFRTPEWSAALAAVPPPNQQERSRPGVVDPRELMRALGPALPDDALVVCGVAHFWGFPIMYMPTAPSVDWLFSYEFGAIGQTLPVAIGAALARPDRTVVVIEGDGSLLMNVQEIDTAARYGVRMLLVVMNDAGFGAEVHKLRAKGHPAELAAFATPSFAALGRAFGGEGAELTDVGQTGALVRAAADTAGPFVIDARVDPEVVSDPYRKIHFGLPNAAPRLLPAGEQAAEHVGVRR